MLLACAIGSGVAALILMWPYTDPLNAVLFGLTIGLVGVSVFGGIWFLIAVVFGDFVTEKGSNENP